MMGGMRGLNSAGDRAANSDNIRDESIVGAAYDHRVVMRLLSYIAPYKHDAILAVLAVGAVYRSQRLHPLPRTVRNRLRHRQG